MGLRINFNNAALSAHRTLSGTDNALGKSIERLSSGFKINSAGTTRRVWSFPRNCAPR
jgi:flagellin